MGFRYSAMIFFGICFVHLFFGSFPLESFHLYRRRNSERFGVYEKKSCYGVYYYYTMLFSDDKAEVDQLCLNTTLLFLVRNAAICFMQ